MGDTGALSAPRRGTALGAIAIQTLIAAATFVVAKAALTAFRPLELAGLRMLGAATLMGVLALPGILRRRSSVRKHGVELLLLGLLGVTVNQVCFLSGLALSTPTHAALLYALTPAFVHLFAVARGDERPGITRAAGIVLAFGGAAILIGAPGPRADIGGLPREAWSTQSLHNEIVHDEASQQQTLHMQTVNGTRASDTRSVTLTGDLLLLVAVIAWAFYSAGARTLVGEIGARSFTALTLAAGAAAGLPIVAPALGAFSPAAISTQAWMGLAFLIVFTSVIAYVLWTFALRGLEASQVAISANAQPVLTAILSYFVLHEPLGWAVVAGGALVLSGVALTQTEFAAGRTAA